MIKINSKLVLFSDDTSLIITKSSPVDLKKDIATAYVQLKNGLMLIHNSLYYEKMHYTHFMIKVILDIVIGYNNKLVTSTSNTNFLQMLKENPLSWKSHIDQLISKLCTACFAIGAIKTFMSVDTLKLLYYSYFPSLRNSGKILHIVFMFSDYKKE